MNHDKSGDYMKLKFKNQDFETDAVNAIVDLFTGQEKNQATFSLAQGKGVQRECRHAIW